MSARPCPRLWQVEAVEDGHLVGVDRASFDRHAATCAECAREIETLSALRRQMQQVSAPDPSPLELRRVRVAVLEGAHARRTRGRPPLRAVWVLAAVAAVVVLGWGVSTRLHVAPSAPLSPGGSARSAAPVFEIVTLTGPEVTGRTEGGTTRAVLSDGVAAFHVEHVAPGLRFVVSLPDGEIEVRGTRFTVVVREGRTRSVEVTEGVVVLRLQGEPERQIRSGQQWASPPAASMAPTTAAQDLPAPAPLPAPGVTAPRGPAAPIATPPVAPPEGASSMPTAPGPRSAANDRFARAVAAFQAGSYAEADAMLASLARDFPGDDRAEDVAFLRAVARSRLGDAAGAAALARAYLRSFPHGLRRREAEDLAHVTDPPARGL